MGHFSTAYQMSTFFFTILSLFSPKLVSLEAAFAGYAALLSVCALASWMLVHPWDKFDIGDNARLAPYISVGRPTKSTQKVVFTAAVRRTLASGAFWALGAYKTTMLFSMQFFVSTLQPRQERATGVARRTANIAFNALASFLGLFIAAPLVGRILDESDRGAAIISRTASLLSVAYNALLLVSELASWPVVADLPSYFIWASARICFFAFFFAYVVQLFGYDDLGTLVGVQSLVAASVSLVASRPLATLAFRVNNGVAFAALGIAATVAVSHAIAELVLFRRGPGNDDVKALDSLVDASGTTVSQEQRLPPSPTGDGEI